MSDWHSLRLGDAATIKHGYAYEGRYFSEMGPGSLVVTPGNFNVGGGWRGSKPKYYLGPDVPGYVLTEGALVVTMTDLSKSGDTLGYSAFVPSGGPYLHNQRIGLVSVSDPHVLDERFLGYLLRSPDYRHHVLSTATGSTVRHTSPSRILDYAVQVPPLDEQRQMASVLDTFSSKLELNDRMRLLLRARGFAELADAQAKARSVLLGDLVTSAARGVAPKYSEEAESVLYLNQRCVRDGWVNAESARRALPRKLSSERMVHRDDVLVNSGGLGTLGRAARWLSEDPVHADGLLTILRPDVGKVHPAVLGYLMIKAQARIEMLAEGSTGQTHLPKESLMQLELSVPERQWDLGEVLDVLDHLAEGLAKEARLLAGAVETLLPPLLSGQIRVREAGALMETA